MTGRTPEHSASVPLSPAYPDRAAWGTAPSLRAWQHAAMTKYFDTNPRDFLAVATPGAGKTTFALSVAAPRHRPPNPPPPPRRRRLHRRVTRDTPDPL